MKMLIYIAGLKANPIINNIYDIRYKAQSEFNPVRGQFIPIIPSGKYRSTRSLLSVLLYAAAELDGYACMPLLP